MALRSEIDMNYEFPSRKIDLQALQKECLSPYDCEHPHAQIRKKTDKTGRPRFYKQCLSCGNSVGKQLKKESIQDPASVDGFDEDLKDKVWSNYQKRYEKRRNEEMQRVEEVWSRNYDLYINSPEWRERRKLVFLRAGGKCEGCLSKAATDCHHTTYDNIGQEFLFELLALCDACHKRYHAHIFPEFLKSLYSDIIIQSGRNLDEPT